MAQAVLTSVAGSLFSSLAGSLFAPSAPKTPQVNTQQAQQQQTNTVEAEAAKLRDLKRRQAQQQSLFQTDNKSVLGG